MRADGLINVELHKMDAEHPEFPDKSFDIVTCAFALFLFPDIEAALREMYRICKPGGCIAMINFNKTPPLRSGLADLAPTVYGVSSWSVDATTAGLHTPARGGSAQQIRIPID